MPVTFPFTRTPPAATTPRGTSRCAGVESVLAGGPADDRSMAAAEAAIAEWAQPADDHRASAEYRRRLLAVTLRRAARKILL